MEDFDNIEKRLAGIQSKEESIDIIEDTLTEDPEVVLKSLEIEIIEGTPCLKYGKYKNRDLGSVPQDYLSKIDRRIKALCKHEHIMDNLSNERAQRLNILNNLCTYLLLSESYINTNLWTEIVKLELLLQEANKYTYEGGTN